MPIKPWSISTTVRNPDRLRGFLGVLTQMDGEVWDHKAQVSFQIRLIQARLFGVYKPQFHDGLPQRWIEFMTSERDIPFDEAAEIFALKRYKDPPMRGRTSIKALQKFGFAKIVDGAVHVTDLGRALLAEKDDYGEIFLRALLKWQLPNPLDRSFPALDGYNIKPFVGTLRLIAETNRRCQQSGLKEKGLSRREFEMFAMTLINWRDIEKTADEIVALRKQVAQLSPTDKDDFIESEWTRRFAGLNERHLINQTDEIIQLFIMTKFFVYPDQGMSFSADSIDISPYRKTEINAILDTDNGAAKFFSSAAEYVRHLSSIEPLPWENLNCFTEIAAYLEREIVQMGGKPPLPFSWNSSLSLQTMKEQVAMLRNMRISLAVQKRKNELRHPENAVKVIRALRELSAASST